jgi:exopolyphosphatase / guanosine-5'-triphosphate,3'-diphosphate pyrophosphatase
VESTSRTPALAFSTSAAKAYANERARDGARDLALGRLPNRRPVAIVDIGSNSVRLVAYEGLTRAPTPIFNEKVLCALGRGVATTGRLNEDGVGNALAALRRFRALCDAMGIADVRAIATAAVRDAVNRAVFVRQARAAIGVDIELLSGKREAELSALGVVSSIHDPDGIVGDLGGGSLELVEVNRTQVRGGLSLRLGGLSLMDLSGKSPKKAIKVVRDALKEAPLLERLRGRTFYAVGGTWRNLARLHMAQRNHPLRVMHGYGLAPRDVEDFAHIVESVASA